MNNILKIEDLHVVVKENKKKILNGITLEIKDNEIHAIMGLNGSGKSTLLYTIMGYPIYEVTKGSITYNGKNLLEIDVSDRAKLGLFLVLQYPIAIPGISVLNFLRTSYIALHGKIERLGIWIKELKELMKKINLDVAFLDRFINDGFSGGEKKKLEILQMYLLNPKMILLDEVDSGLDVDSLKNISTLVDRYLSDKSTNGIIVTHYSRILKYIKPDYVHICYQGKLIYTGDSSLIDEIDKTGYDKYIKQLNK